MVQNSHHHCTGSLLRSGLGWCPRMSPCHCPVTPGPTSWSPSSPHRVATLLRGPAVLSTTVLSMSCLENWVYFTFAKKWRHTCILILCRWLLIIIILSLFGKMVTILKIKLKPIDSFCLRLIDFYYLWFIMAWQFKIYYCPSMAFSVSVKSSGTFAWSSIASSLLNWSRYLVSCIVLVVLSPVLCVSRYQTM